jgi:hypothetical protein
MKTIKVNWDLLHIERDRQFYRYLEDVLLDAKEQGAEKVILPDNMTDCLLSLHPGADPKDALSPYTGAIQHELKRLSKESGIIIETGPLWVDEESFRFEFNPSGHFQALATP